MASRARRLTLSRRALLGSAAAATLAAGCGETSPPATRRPGPRRIHYAEDHPDQFADLRLPTGTPHGTVVLLHGGYWQPGYGLDQLDPIATVLTASGWATWNVEYRPIGAGSAYPAPMADVARSVDRLAREDLADTVVTLGHSAGGHLAVWAASRNDATPGGPPLVRPTGAVSLSGVLDLVRAASAPGSGPPVTAFAGGSPTEVPQHYAFSDPALLVPATCPVWAVHAEDDQVVPLEQATSYVSRARAAGGRTEVVTVPGDHFSMIDPRAPSWETIERLVTVAADA